MARLALAVEDESRVGAREGDVPVEPRVAAAVFRQLGVTVLLYRRQARRPSYFARARVAAVAEPRDGRFICRLADIMPFAAPVDGGADGAAPGSRRMLWLDDERFDEVLRLGNVSVPEAAAAEAAAPFDTRPLDAFLSIRAEILKRWSYRCAVTDTQFAAGEAPELRLVPIRPRRPGEPLDIRNYLPVVEIAERAWLRGDISATDEFDVIAVLSRLDPDLLVALPRDGRLVLPEDPALWPDPRHVAAHRSEVFGR